MSGRDLAAIRPLLDGCVHCGLCLPTCPTHALLGTEMDSPRGRIWLIRALADERVEPTPRLLSQLDGCLDCRACETACPSGVRYGGIIEGARAALEPARARPAASRFLRNALLRHVVSSGAALELAARSLRLAERSGLLALLRRPALRPLLGTSLGRLIALAPPISARPLRGRTDVPAARPGRPRVALFTGCIMDAFQAHIHEATLRVLQRAGFDVHIPRTQACCGALHRHSGDAAEADRLARRNLDAFPAGEAQWIVLDSAGCGAALKEYAEWIDDPRAAEFSKRCVDLSVLLASVPGLRATRPIPRRAVYDDPCHLLHAQRVGGEPRELLRRIPGLELLPLREADWCCGAAGVYNLTQPELSAALLRRKLDHIESTGADLVLTANPGCLLQLSTGLRERDSTIEVRHLAELLDGANLSREETPSDKPHEVSA